MSILNALSVQNQCNLNVGSKCILNALRIRKGDTILKISEGQCWVEKSTEVKAHCQTQCGTLSIFTHPHLKIISMQKV